MSKLKDWFKKAWVDQVGSKVIAGLILSALGGIGTGAFLLLNNIPFSSILPFLSAPIYVPLWSVIMLGIMLLALLLFSFRIWPFRAKITPNDKLNVTENTRSSNFPDRDEQRQLLHSLRNSELTFMQFPMGPLEDPHEYRFYSIEKIRKMEGVELKRHLDRFLGGAWDLKIRKGPAENSYVYNFSILSDGVLLRSRPGMKQKFNVQMRQIQFNAMNLELKWVAYSETEKLILERETLTIKNDEVMTGVNENGFVVTYLRKNLFRAV